jgi:hypothetical protein
MPDFLHFSWWLIVAFGIAGILSLYNGLNRTNPRLKQTGLALLVLAALLSAIRIVSPTDIERVERATNDLCQCAVRNDWPGFAAFLDPNVAAGFDAANPVFSKSDDVAAAAKATCEANHVTAIKIISQKSTQSGDTISTVCRLTAIVDIKDYGEGQPIPSDWTMEWHRSGGQWLLSKVILTNVAGQNPSDVPEVGRFKMH